MSRLIEQLRQSSVKAMYKHLDLEAAISNLYEFNHAYIVGGYLVVYEIGTPWYSKELFLHELLVLRLYRQGDFRVVPTFLASEAREAGAVVACAGTALALSDRALASLYHRSGFKTEALSLTKEI